MAEDKRAPSQYVTAIQEYLQMVSKHEQGHGDYLDKGSVRPVEPLTESETEEAHHLIETHDLGMKQCWWNCQLIAGAHHEFQYVEGYTMSESAPIPIHHAWVEKNGKVWELTMSDGPTPPPRAVYFGVPVETGTVNEQVDKLGEAHPILTQKPHR